jgi:structural maintenance of chromosome 3 (chondroitin sulfate proteoglycan 6)
VYGPVIELVECAPAFHKAAEVAAGGALFHIVVDSDATASRCIKLMLQHRLDRLTFLPLNRLQARERSYPEMENTMPLVRNLGHDPRIAKAVLQIFGRTMVCRDLETGSKVVERHDDLDCITLDGDKVSRKGALTGGYIAPTDTKLALQARIKHSTARSQVRRGCWASVGFGGCVCQW